MRRLVTVVVLLLCAVPFGVAVSGCSKNSTIVYCNGGSSGVIVGQTTTLDLEPRLTGISLNQGQITTVSTPTARDCKGSTSAASNIQYGTTDVTLADVAPTTGALCAGTWNRNTGGGVADFTTCTPATRSGTAYVTASAEGVSSNPLPVYVHPVVTSIVLGPASTNCVTDPASNCAFDATQANGCSLATPSTVIAYDGTSCISQGKGAQLAARSFQGTNTSVAANNISCRVGPLTFLPQNASVVTIDQNGLATAAQPGSTVISARISNSASSAGFFSTCPPASIVLTTPGSTTAPTAPVNVSQNVSSALVATVVDTKGVPLTNVQLEYISTTPTTIPAGSSTITPTFPGSAAITAICQPPTCNSAPFNQIGLFNNGTPVTSNPVQLNATGSNSSTVLYIGSTQSQYLQPYDFTVSTQTAPVRLPYVPNSLVLSTDLASIYLGTSSEIMIFSTGTNALTREDTTLSGTVLAVSPDSATVVVTDPVRKLTYLYNPVAGANTNPITTQYGGVGTRAVFSPDSQTVYIPTTDGRLLVYSTFTGWSAVALSSVASDATVTVPHAGVYLANGAAATTARTLCPVTTVSGTGLSQTTTNTFYPQADVNPVMVDRLTATNDGVHILGASTTRFADLRTNQKSGACPIPFTSTLAANPLFTGIVPTAITNVLATSDSAFAFATYTGTGAQVPQYAVATSTLSNVALAQAAGSAAPTAPVNGVVSADNKTLYVGTSGDNLVHRLARGASGFTDSLAPLTPALPGITGGTATPNLLAQRPRKSTS